MIEARGNPENIRQSHFENGIGIEFSLLPLGESLLSRLSQLKEIDIYRSVCVRMLERAKRARNHGVTCITLTSILTSRRKRASSYRGRHVNIRAVMGFSDGDSPGIRTRNQRIKRTTATHIIQYRLVQSHIVKPRPVGHFRRYE